MSKYLDTTKLSIREIDRKLARDMIIKNHYSQKWTKCSVALGLYYSDGTQHKFFDMEDEKLIGVICYGDPIGRHSGASISTEIRILIRNSSLISFILLSSNSSEK